RDGLALSRTMEALMCARPAHWQAHYTGDQQALRLQRHFGYADRIRYYWPDPAAQAAVKALMDALAALAPAPAPLVAQYFAPSVVARARALADAAGSWARALVWAEVQQALAPYFVGAD